jgi:hypothetical protein
LDRRLGGPRDGLDAVEKKEPSISMKCLEVDVKRQQLVAPEEGHSFMKLVRLYEDLKVSQRGVS